MVTYTLRGEIILSDELADKFSSDRYNTVKTFQIFIYLFKIYFNVFNSSFNFFVGFLFVFLGGGAIFSYVKLSILV